MGDELGRENLDEPGSAGERKQAGDDSLWGVGAMAERLHRAVRDLKHFPSGVEHGPHIVGATVHHGHASLAGDGVAGPQSQQAAYVDDGQDFAAQVEHTQNKRRDQRKAGEGLRQGDDLAHIFGGEGHLAPRNQEGSVDASALCTSDFYAIILSGLAQNVSFHVCSLLGSPPAEMWRLEATPAEPSTISRRGACPPTSIPTTRMPSERSEVLTARKFSSPTGLLMPSYISEPPASTARTSLHFSVGTPMRRSK